MSKFVILAICAVVLIFLIKNKFAYQKKEEKIDTTDMVKDPVCGTYVEEDSEYRLRYLEKTYSFCSEECKNKFKALKQGEGQE